MRRHLFDHVNMSAAPAIHPQRRRARLRGARRAASSARSSRAGGLDLCLARHRPQRPHRLQRAGRGARRAHTPRAAAPGARVEQRATCSAVDWRDVPTHALSMGIGTILSARARRAARDRRSKGRDRRARADRTDDDAGAGVAPAGASERRWWCSIRTRRKALTRSYGGRGHGHILRASDGQCPEAVPCPLHVPLSCALRRRRVRDPRRARRGSSRRRRAGVEAPAGRCTPAFFMTIAAFTFHFARRSSSPASSGSMPGHDRDDAAARGP